VRSCLPFSLWKGQLWAPEKIVGVDIDAELVAAAWKRRRYLWSFQAPDARRASVDGPGESSKHAGQKRKREDCDGPDTIVPLQQARYFPIAMQHLFGQLPLPSATPETSTVFPHNVAFITTDWIKAGCAYDSEGYDIVLALSITKWVHLNDGDDGIRAFFSKIHSVLRTGGKLVLEIQPWNTYGKAKRMHPKLKENGSKLQIRPEAFSTILTEMGFGDETLLGTPGDGGFQRPVSLYIKER